MKFKSTSKFLLWIFIAIGIIFYLIIFLSLRSRLVSQRFNIEAALIEAPLLVSQAVSEDQALDILIESEIPVYLKIPKIKVEVFLEQAGLKSNGEVDVPIGQLNAAWFKLWPRPGEIGNAIIVGHYGIFQDGTAAVFNNLYQLNPGDKIYTEDIDGLVTTFIVSRLQLYNPDDVAVDVFNSDDNKAHLNLITCWGDWDETANSYSKRLVVFADKE